MASVALAVLVAGGCGGEPRPTLVPDPPPPSTTSPPQVEDVHAVIRRGLSQLRSFRAEIVVTHAGRPGETRVTFERGSNGRVKEVESTSDSERTFFQDGADGRSVFSYAPAPGRGRPVVQVRTGLPVGPPTSHAQNLPMWPDPVTSARQVLEWDDARVSREPVDGRPAWIVQHTTPGGRPDLHVVTVDDRTGLALRVDGLHAGQPEFGIRVQTLVTDLEAEPSFDLPVGVPVSTTHMPSTRVSVEEAVRAVGYRPLLPAWVPEGFSRAEVGVMGQLEPWGRDVVSVAFRRGMDVVVVTSARRRAGATNPWGPPARPRPDSVGEPADEPGRREPLEFERVTLGAGAFAGVEAERSVNGHLGQSLFYVAGDSLVVTVVGDLTAPEVVRLAESLQPAR